MKIEEYLMRVRFKTLGGHTHCDVFTGKARGQLGKAGELIMRNDEFFAWYFGRHAIEFVTDDAETFRAITEIESDASKGLLRQSATQNKNA